MATALKDRPKPAKKPASTPEKSATLTIQAPVLRRMVQTVAPFASPDADRPIITALHCYVSDGSLVVEGTDSYTLAIASTRDYEPDTGAGFDVLIPAAWLVRWSKIKPSACDDLLPMVTIAHSNGSVTITDSGLQESFTTKAVSSEYMQYPDLRKLFDGNKTDGGVVEGETAFNPVYYRRCFDAAARWSNAPMRLSGVGGLKPFAATVTGHYGTLELLLMPVRLP